jgi:hypothetical protein
MSWVVDVNVLRTANGEATQASEECQDACIDFLLRCQADNGLVLDDANELLALYAKSNDFSGQPGVGDQFFAWAHATQAMQRRVVLSPEPEDTYGEVPVNLTRFDRDDHIYLALAVASGAPIVNAVDSDYAEARDLLEVEGIAVVELCAEPRVG